VKVLFIGGTGLISTACSQLALDRGIELDILNRAKTHKHDVPVGARLLVGDIHGDRAALEKALGDTHYDAIVDWVAFTPADIEADISLFTRRTRQFMFISSASVYQKPPNHYLITEDTPLANPHWAYSQNKIACEERLMREYRERGFPITIVRPSLTYGVSQIPMIMGSWQHPWTLVDRMLRGQKVIVPGDGTSLWPLTWNGDFAKGLVGLLGREQAIGHAFHITSDEVLSWEQIYIELAHALGVEPKIVHMSSELIVAHDPSTFGSLIGDKIYSVVFDNSKIKRFVPDFVATVPWTEGVRRALAWFRTDPARQTIDVTAVEKWDKIIAAYERAWPIS
jgi:nucleoside-diphosphate-sugar epimerase